MYMYNMVNKTRQNIHCRLCDCIHTHFTIRLQFALPPSSPPSPLLDYIPKLNTG